MFQGRSRRAIPGSLDARNGAARGEGASNKNSSRDAPHRRCSAARSTRRTSAIWSWRSVRATGCRLDEVRFIPPGGRPTSAASGQPVCGAAWPWCGSRCAATRASWCRRSRRGGVARRSRSRRLRRVAAETPRARLYLLMGADSLDEFATWREPEAIVSLAHPGGGRRPARRPFAPPVEEPLARRGAIAWLDNAEIDALVEPGARARARARHSVRYLVPDAVAAYIARHRPLPRPGDELPAARVLAGPAEPAVRPARHAARPGCRSHTTALATRCAPGADPGAAGDQAFDSQRPRVLDVGCGTGFFTAYYLRARRQGDRDRHRARSRSGTARPAPAGALPARGRREAPIRRPRKATTRWSTRWTCSTTSPTTHVGRRP